MKFSVNLLIIAVYNLCLVAGTAWLIVEHNWSAWWFALTIALLGTHGTKKDSDE